MAAENNTATQSNYSSGFDIGIFFNMIRTIPAGLCWYLAKVLLENASQRCGRNRRDCRDKTEDALDIIEDVIAMNKKYQEQSERSPNVKA